MPISICALRGLKPLSVSFAFTTGINVSALLPDPHRNVAPVAGRRSRRATKRWAAIRYADGGLM
jgi:hypothetical protein